MRDPPALLAPMSERKFITIRCASDWRDQAYGAALSSYLHIPMIFAYHGSTLRPEHMGDLPSVRHRVIFVQKLSVRGMRPTGVGEKRP